MVLVKYSQGKLLRVAITCGLFTALFVLLFVSRTLLTYSFGWWRLFGTGFGHYVLAPALIVCLGIFCWRTASLSAGNLLALRATPNEIYVTTLWRTVRIAWSDLESVRMERLGIGWGIQGQLLLRTGSDTVRLPLRLTDTPGARGGELVAKLEELRDKALKRPRAPVTAAVADEGGAFDADAAIARYLARKQAARTVEEADQGIGAQPAPLVPARPVFGRKGA